MKKDKKTSTKPVIQKVKKEKTEGYIMKKNTGMKVMRIVFWVMLVFVFIRGIVTIFKPDKEEAIEAMIADFKANYSDFTNQNEEVMSFAQNFAKEYLTYEVKGEESYKKRLQDYVTTSFLNTGYICDFNSEAKVTYAQAYRMEDYSDNQKDIYVLVEMTYTSQQLDEAGENYTTISSSNQLVLRVPVYCNNGLYIVENIPQIVSDSNYLNSYKPEDYYGTSLTDIQKTAVDTSVENFLRAYYEQDESVINYYLESNADKNTFCGLNKRFTFESIDTINSYLSESGNIICLVTYMIKDSENGAKMLQKINLSVQENGGKYYIESMNVRTGNLNKK